MRKLNQFVFWFVTGSQHLYGQETLKQVEVHSQSITQDFAKDGGFPCSIIFKPVMTTPVAIHKLCIDANADAQCAGIITWMHTFSPAKMWITGLSELRKPLLHLHTQYNRDIPWASIDMDYMNLHQSAHGDREYGFIGTRLGIQRKVVVGHWTDAEVRQRIQDWMRASVAYCAGRSLKVARFGDNMREVAVTEGDKVGAQIKLGWTVNGYGIGDLARVIEDVTDAQTNTLLQEYKDLYTFTGDILSNNDAVDSIREQARIELGMKAFLEEGGYEAFTTTFEDLYGLKQLPGLAVQRLMHAGYGFGAEGDWKTSALVRIMKLMSDGKSGGTSFMEDYTYHLEPGNELVLGAHMLEVCPTLASNRPQLQVHPLTIGAKADPARLVFDGAVGPAVSASLIDLGNRFRLIVNEVNAVPAPYDMPKLPVARLLWKPLPSLKDAAEAWILSGGAHHTSFSLALNPDHLMDWAVMADIECITINQDTSLRQFRNELRYSDSYWSMKSR